MSLNHPIGAAGRGMRRLRASALCASAMTVHAAPGAFTSGPNGDEVPIDPEDMRFRPGREEVWKTPTPAGYRQPLSVPIDRALGGGWPIDHLTSADADDDASASAGTTSLAVMAADSVSLFRDGTPCAETASAP